MIERISSFRVVRTISEGEKNALLHAVSEKSGERVAVRLFRGSSATEEMEQRCQRAVQVTQLLAHPAVVRIIQAGRLPDGSVYQIQEQLSGETLATRLSSRPRLQQNELLRLSRQIATVLTAAHARGVVHRALRPESLQLVPDPEAVGGERVKITDWGLAQLPAGGDKATQGEKPADGGKPAPGDQAAAGEDVAAGDQAVAGDQAAVGDPLIAVPTVPLDEPTYLAPEQCRAAAAAAPGLVPGPVDPEAAAAVADRIDVYALGVLLFQLATGQPPFAGRTASEVIALHIAALPPKLADKGVTTPPELPALVAAMLIKDPTARPTMQEVEARLQQLTAQQQLARTMLPPAAAAAAAAPLPPMQPNGNVTVQLRVGPEPLPARPPRWRLAAGLGGGLLIAGLVVGLVARRGGAPSAPNPPPAIASGASAADPAATGEPAAAPAASAQGAGTAAAPAASAPGATGAGAAATASGSFAAGQDKTTPSPPPSAASAETTGSAAAPAPPTPAGDVNPRGPSSPARTATDAEDTQPAAAPIVAGSAAALATLGAHTGLAGAGGDGPAVVAGAAKPAGTELGPEAAERAQKLLMHAQSAFDRGEYPQTIALANEAMPLKPKEAAVLLGKSGCTLGDLALVSRAYTALRKSPPELNLVLAECRKYGIVLGAHGHFVHKAH